MKSFALAVTLCVTVVSGCTWVKLDDAGAAVRVVYGGDVGACRDLGEIGVSVKDRVGPYERNTLKVKDELESLARNEAAHMHADTIKARGEPVDGEQRFGAYACGTSRPVHLDKSERSDAAETFPVR